MKERELDGVKLTDSEEKKLKEKLQNEILKHSWRFNHLTWMGKNQLRLAEELKMENLLPIGKHYQKYDKDNFPHHILGGKTWMLFNQGYLLENPEEDKKIREFYKKEYKQYLKTARNLESDFPIFIIGDYCPKLSGKVLPLIIDYNNNKKVIVLYMNE